MDDPGQKSRDTAEAFGDRVEEMFDKGKDAVDVLHHGAPQPAPPPPADNDDGDGDVTININR